MLYKLKKELPIANSPKVGALVKVNHAGIAQISWPVGIDVEPAKNPEYWEKDCDGVFVTLDDVTLKEGEPAFPVAIKEGLNIVPYVVPTRAIAPYEGMGDEVVFFSTQENAIEYIIRNKPCISIENILRELRDVPDIKYKFRHLVKSTLNI